MKQFRFDYTNEFSELLEKFAKDNQSETRQTYKKNWNIWKEQNKRIYESEIERIKKKGYPGNIEEKIFESVRYYYRKKLNPSKENNPRIEKKKAEKLKGLSSEIKQLMDTHMKVYISENTPPAEAFDDFCKRYLSELEKEIYRLKNSSKTQLDPIATTIKFKKAYKNRFYKIVQCCYQ